MRLPATRPEKWPQAPCSGSGPALPSVRWRAEAVADGDGVRGMPIGTVEPWCTTITAFTGTPPGTAAITTVAITMVTATTMPTIERPPITGAAQTERTISIGQCLATLRVTTRWQTHGRAPTTRSEARTPLAAFRRIVLAVVKVGNRGRRVSVAGAACMRAASSAAGSEEADSAGAVSAGAASVVSHLLSE